MPDVSLEDAQRVYDAAATLWVAAQKLIREDDVVPARWGLAVNPVAAKAIAEESGVELALVDECLRAMDGSVLVVGRGEASNLTVKALLPGS